MAKDKNGNWVYSPQDSYTSAVDRSNTQSNFAIKPTTTNVMNPSPSAIDKYSIGTLTNSTISNAGQAVWDDIAAMPEADQEAWSSQWAANSNAPTDGSSWSSLFAKDGAGMGMVSAFGDVANIGLGYMNYRENKKMNDANLQVIKQQLAHNAENQQNRVNIAKGATDQYAMGRVGV